MKTLPFFLLNIHPRVQNSISHGDGYIKVHCISTRGTAASSSVQQRSEEGEYEAALDECHETRSPEIVCLETFFNRVN